LYFKSKGIPRLVNILTHKALLAAYGKGKHQVGLVEAFAAISDTKSIESRWRKLRFHGFSLSLFLFVCGSAFMALPK
jgi:MSHA biogenesis protein MshM